MRSALLRHRGGSSCAIGKASVCDYLKRADKAGLTWAQAKELSDAELEGRLFRHVRRNEPSARAPIDFAWVHRELRRTGVTLQLLWLEYQEAVAQRGDETRAYQYSQFCELYASFRDRLEPSMRQVHRAGEKAFVDYSGKKPHLVDRETGELIEVELFVMVLGASNYTYAEATRTQRLADFVASNVRAFDYLGCVPEVADGCAMGPLDALSGGIRTLHYEVGVALRDARRPSRLGGVGTRAASGRFAATRRTHGPNPRPRRCCGCKRCPASKPKSIGPTSDSCPCAADSARSGSLRSFWPTRGPASPDWDMVTLVPVDRTAFVRLDTNRYSVPHTYASRTLTLVASDTELRLLDGDQPVAHHARCWGRSQWHELPAHRAALVQENRAARELKGRDRLRTEVPEIEPVFERSVDAGRNLGSMIARVIVLLDAYGAPVMRRALADMIARGTHDPGALAILCEQQRRRRGDGPVRVVVFGDHVRERDVVPHDLGGYDE